MSKPWFEDGLRFSCTRCGKCCTGEPGFVWVDEEEIQAIATFRGETVEEVLGLYTRMIREKRTLREKLNNDCIFWEADVGCTIYPVRPRQCRTWPFWESNIRTPADWEHTQQVCPGSGQGELISAEEILERMRVIRL